MRCLVTVGTTSFDALMSVLDELLQVLKEQGFTHVSVQYGRGGAPPLPQPVPGLTVDAFGLKPTLKDEVAAADLVVCHGGLGSLMEALSARKRVLCVVNESLMGNHQLEIAEQMDDVGCHVFRCVPATLAQTLRTADWSTRVPLPKARPEAYVDMLDKLFGFQDKSE